MIWATGTVGEVNRSASILSFVLFRNALLVLAASLLCFSSNSAESKRTTSQWVPLKGCLYMTEEASDGDSFHVKFGQREFIFRLYFVDAPETDSKLEERVKEQCKYFGVTTAEHRKAAAAAKTFTAEWLKTPFLVTTRWQNALGRSRLPRYYALIDSGGHNLAEMLVQRGLARAKGTVAILPDGTRAKDHMEKLKRAETEARTKRVGIWATSSIGGKQ